MNKQLLVALGLLAVVAVVGVVYPRPLPTTNVTNTPLGTVSGTDVSGCFTINGVTTCAAKQAVRSATTTICALRSPTFASSTLVSGGIRFTVSSSTQATQVTIVRSSNPYATTTTNAVTIVPLASSTISAGLSPSLSFMATNTYPTVNENLTDLIAEDKTFAPGEYIVVGFAGGQHVTSGRPTGSCTAQWQLFD